MRIQRKQSESLAENVNGFAGTCLFAVKCVA
jgi:hypothetical protein